MTLWSLKGKFPFKVYVVLLCKTYTILSHSLNCILCFNSERSTSADCCYNERKYNWNVCTGNYKTEFLQVRQLTSVMGKCFTSYRHVAKDVTCVIARSKERKECFHSRFYYDDSVRWVFMYCIIYAADTLKIWPSCFLFLPYRQRNITQDSEWCVLLRRACRRMTFALLYRAIFMWCRERWRGLQTGVGIWMMMEFEWAREKIPVRTLESYMGVLWPCCCSFSDSRLLLRLDPRCKRGQRAAERTHHHH